MKIQHGSQEIIASKKNNTLFIDENTTWFKKLIASRKYKTLFIDENTTF
jgi:hypothetical protein